MAYFEDTEEVEILYVDYGGYNRVKIETLRQIRLVIFFTSSKFSFLFYIESIFFSIRSKFAIYFWHFKALMDMGLFESVHNPYFPLEPTEAHL